MKTLELENCSACRGSGVWQINEPLLVGLCNRCHGVGKDRVVQIVDCGRGFHKVLTANGNIYQTISKLNDRRDDYEYVWQEIK